MKISAQISKEIFDIFNIQFGEFNLNHLDLDKTKPFWHQL